MSESICPTFDTIRVVDVFLKKKKKKKQTIKNMETPNSEKSCFLNAKQLAALRTRVKQGSWKIQRINHSIRNILGVSGYSVR